MAELAQLKNSTDFVEAQIAKATLEAYGIPAFLFDEHLGGNMFPPLSLSGVRLMVPESRVAETMELLDTNSDLLDGKYRTILMS